MRTTAELKQTFLHGTGPQQARAASAVFVYLDEYLPWLEARALTGVTLTRKDEGYLIVVKATHKGLPQVGFAFDRDVGGVMVQLARKLVLGQMSWRPDRYGTMRSDKTA